MRTAGGALQRSAIIGLNAYWRQKRFEYSSSILIYFGFHAESDVGTDDPNWSVWKLNYTGNDLTLIEGPLTGAWDNRASLAWL
jgi:hypothetical protein